MPIVKLQQNIASLREGMVHLGRIRKGAPKPENSKKPGEDLPYWRIEMEPQFESMLPIVHEVFANHGDYAEGPEWFEGAHVLEDTADKAFTYWMEQWGGGGTLYHRCDGEKQHQHYDGTAYSFARINCAIDHTTNPCACQRIGRLALWFDPLVAATGEFGYFTVFTSSINDIVTIQKQLQAAEYMAARAGLSLMAVPFIFGRYDKAISSPAFKQVAGKWERTDKRTIITKSLVSMRPDPRWNIRVLLPAIETAKFLPPPAAVEPKELRLADGVKLLGNGGTSRRIGTLEKNGNGGSGHAAVLEAEPEPMSHEVLDAPPPADLFDEDVEEAVFEETKPEPWTKEQQTQFYRHWQAELLSDSDMLKALGVKGLGQWKDTLEAANKRVDEYIAEQAPKVSKDKTDATL